MCKVHIEKVHGIKDIASNFVAAQHSLQAARTEGLPLPLPLPLSLPQTSLSLYTCSPSLHLSISFCHHRCLNTYMQQLQQRQTPAAPSLFLLSSSLLFPLPHSLLPSSPLPIPSVIGCLLGLAYKPRLLKIANTFASVARTLLAGQSFFDCSLCIWMKLFGF